MKLVSHLIMKNDIPNRFSELPSKWRTIGTLRMYSRMGLLAKPDDGRVPWFYLQMSLLDKLP